MKIPNLSKYATVVGEQISRDGTKKFLLKLLDGNQIECVLLLQDYGNTVCISSQVGCKMGCAFCASGKNGFVRNLSMEEMLAQVLVARKQSPAGTTLTHVVIMGTGEPFDNFENVANFLKNVDIGARKISVSTCGIPDKIREFADLGLQVNLCVSLHAPNDTIRQRIMPIARTHKIATVMSAVKYFFEKTHRRVIFEYALIDGINAEPENAAELIKLVKSARISAHVNLINLNADGGNLKPPHKEKGLRFMDTLIKGGISVTMRKGRGTDILAACGQLKLQSEAAKTQSTPIANLTTPTNPTSAQPTPANPQPVPVELSISLDPAISGGNLREYLTELNHLRGISIHLDLMRAGMVGHNRCTYDDYKYVIQNSAHPVDVHEMADVKLETFGIPRAICTHINGTAIDLDVDPRTLAPQLEVINATPHPAVVVMCVRAGQSGQVFNPAALKKIKYIRAAYPNVRIIADGGINAENIAAVKSACGNANASVVVGSFIYKLTTQEARAQCVEALLDILRK
jgi:23S rRNA (adenine2503-C2)-methyltransferase